MKGEGTPVEGAVVEFSGTKQRTDDQGRARFYNVASLPGMPYTVSAPDYDSATGQVDVTGDEEIEVNFVTTEIEDIPDDQWQFYPNPIHKGHSLHIIFPEGLQDIRLSIYDMTGKMVFSRSYKSVFR